MTFKERLKNALEQDNTIMVSKQELSKPDFKHAGFGFDHMKFLGLSKSDLKKLERLGFAVRTYTQNEWRIPATYDEQGKELTPLQIKVSTGHRVRWLLLVEG